MIKLSMRTKDPLPLRVANEIATNCHLDATRVVDIADSSQTARKDDEFKGFDDVVEGMSVDNSVARWTMHRVLSIESKHNKWYKTRTTKSPANTQAS